MVSGGLVVVLGGFRVALGTQDFLNTNMLVSLMQTNAKGFTLQWHIGLMV